MARTNRIRTPLARWMDAEGISLEQFVQATGIRFTTVSKWRYLGSMPRDIHRRRIAEVYPGCPLGLAKQP